MWMGRGERERETERKGQMLLAVVHMIVVVACT